ncbi:MAG TPA: hypothetical protein O0X25_04540 [Methanocorpusculum sp.]|nr:hypothetical protein [Methanocorpusculum sp.]HJJ57861.1 hypothetical protein [Methanocorpusculum sp.]
MTRERATPLTDEQISIIRGNQETMLPADISHLPGMEGTTVRQIRECQRRKPDLDAQFVADTFEAWIARDGLPGKFAILMHYIQYLRRKTEGK